MRVYLIDGTYELFRHYFAIPGQKAADGTEVAATRGVLASMLKAGERYRPTLAELTEREAKAEKRQTKRRAAPKAKEAAAV